MNWQLLTNDSHERIELPNKQISVMRWHYIRGGTFSKEKRKTMPVVRIWKENVLLRDLRKENRRPEMYLRINEFWGYLELNYLN